MRPDDFSPQSVSYISGRTRLYGIIGHPIAQVRSPEFVTHELISRGIDSMAHRVRACGGTFRSGPRVGGGWTVQAVLPLSA